MTDDDIDKLIGGQERTATPTVAAFKEGVRLLAPPVASKFERYRDDPVGYVRDVLRLEPWSMQQDMLRLCASPPNPADGWYCKLALGAGTNAGKTAFGAMLINWSFDCRGPCIEQTTAPSQNSVVDVLWKEVRIQRCRADARWGIGLSDFIGPRAPEMRRAENWYAKGTVAQSGDTFKGRHGDNMVWLFDESPGIMDHYFEVTKTMFKPDGKMLWICLYNPTDSTSALYQEIMHPNSTWTVEELSTLDHPNIIAALEGREPPIPNAVTVEQMEEAIANDCDVVLEEDVVATDFQWKDVWYRPGSLFEWAFLGRWPTGSDADLWPDALWKSITEPPLTLDKVKITVEEIPQIGMDMATKGDNRDIVVAWGNYAMHHESRSFAGPMRTVGRIIELAREWSEKCNRVRPRDLPRVTEFMIPIKIDDDSAGGVIAARLREQGYRVIPVGAGTNAARPHRYPNKRSELWFTTRDRARMKDMMFLGLLPRRTLIDLYRQAKGVQWTTDSAGRRVVEQKDITRSRLGRSPDGMDAINLAFYPAAFASPQMVDVGEQKQTFRERLESTPERRSIIGRHGMGRHRGLFGR